jgi:protein O-GlcNAc transferase
MPEPTPAAASPADAGLEQLKARYAALQAQPSGSDGRRELARQLAEHEPSVLHWMGLAFEEFSAFEFPAGHAALEQVLALGPDFLPARWTRMQYPDFLAPRVPADAERYRQRWSDGLAHFEALDFRDPRWTHQVWGCVGQCTAFYRHYIDDAIPEQRRYGALLHRMMSALDPGMRRPPPPRPRRRVLFVSAYLYDHTVGRLFAPLIAGLDPRRLEVHALHLGTEFDALSQALARKVQVHRGPHEAPAWRQLIGQLAPDVIVYVDIGMNPLAQGLAALRLAPRQAALWGHPVTTGLPTIDDFLSPDAMEIPAAQSHYSERLVRLPGLGHGLAAPTLRPPPADIGRAPGSIELFCAQAIFKLMPEHDALFARILARLPNARLHFVSHQNAKVRAWLADRVGETLRASGLDPERRLVLHPLQSLEGFLGLGRACDLVLDSIGWSGGMSSLDLLGAGVPVVTLPGTSMRSRQTAALLRALDAPQLIARDTDDYVEKVVGLATMHERRRALGERLFAGRAKLHQGAPVIAALEDYLAG